MKTARILAASLLLSGLLPAVAQAAYYPSTSVSYGTITRAEFVRMAMEQTGTLYANGTNCFTDVKNQHYAMYVCAAKQQGIVTGKPNGSFMPDMPITFIEAAAVAIRAEGEHVGGGTPWYAPYLERLSDWDSIPDSVRNILDPISRSQAQDLINAVMDRDGDDDDEDDDDTDSDDDLKLTLSVSDTSPDAGDRVTFRIKLENESNDDMDDIEVVAELDDDMEYISSSDDGEEDDDEVEWDDIEVEEDETKTLLLTVEIDDGADEDDTLRLRVQSKNGKTLTVTKSIKVDEDDDDDDGELNITITDSPDPVKEGDTIAYTIKLENDDDDDIRADVRAILDEDTDFVSASDGGDESRDEVEWDNIRIGEDETVTLTLRVKVKGSAKDGQDLELKVEANEEEETEKTEVEDEDDDDDNDNDGSDEDVTVTITDSEDPAEEGDSVTYRITIENNENHDVELDVNALLDDDMSFLSATHDGDPEGDDEVTWDNIKIDEDEERVLSLTVRVKSSANDGDTLRLEVEAGDDEDTETTKIED